MKFTHIAHLVAITMVLVVSGPRTDSPHKVTMTPAAPGAGETVTFVVEMSGSVSQNTQVTIDSASSFWASIPTQVLVEQGEDEVAFQATLATSPSGSNRVTASANGGSASFDVPL